MRSAERAGRLRVIWIDRRLEEQAWSVLERYADLDLSLTDAVTVAVARARRIRSVFGFDDDLAAAGLAVETA